MDGPIGAKDSQNHGTATAQEPDPPPVSPQRPASQRGGEEGYDISFANEKNRKSQGTVLF